MDRNPFSVNIESEPDLSDSNVELLIELSCDTALKVILERTSLIDFGHLVIMSI